MCGIVGAVAQRNVAMILLEGLRRLEYRGYDSAGIAVIHATHPENATLKSVRTVGKVSQLAQNLTDHPLIGCVGVGHTRWATHGRPLPVNAHPQISHDAFAVVHNGIIENYATLKSDLIQKGYVFESDTDTEVIAHLIHQQYQITQDFLKAVQKTIPLLQGNFAFAVIHQYDVHRLIAVRCGSPLVIGLGIEEVFVASDRMALLPFAQQFVSLQKGDVVDVIGNQVRIYNAHGDAVERPTSVMNQHYEHEDKGNYRHHMQKEIFEQPQAVRRLLGSRFCHEAIHAQLPKEALPLLKQVKRVHMVACGSSYHASLLGAYWFEMLGIPCRAEVASEYRYRNCVVEPNTLMVTLSQSGETADTLAALYQSKHHDYLGSLAVCNVPDSLLVRESQTALMTQAGVEVGVASTKAFTTQLVALLLLAGGLAEIQDIQPKNLTSLIIQPLLQLPNAIEHMLALDGVVKSLAMHFLDKQHALFLGRGAFYPVAKEGALKIKEIAYIHAQAYPTGELKHGPLALIDEHMPVILLMPYDGMQDKALSTMNEILARGGDLLVIADERISLAEQKHMRVLSLPSIDGITAPIAYNTVLQLLAYHAAVLKGTDVDQPRNLAKSVTVE